MKYNDISIDFLILSENKDLLTLSIFDTSYWQHLLEKRTVIDIIIPGSNKAVRNYFTKNSINNFNSVNLNINCQTSNCDSVDLIPLPDGLYNIRVLTDGNFIEERNYFRTTELERQFDEYLTSLKFDCDMDECRVKESMYFLFYLKSIEAYTRECNYDKAQLFYEMAEKLIVEKNKNKCKTCK